MNPGTYYVPEGETRRMEIVGVRIGNGESEPMAFVDGSALFVLVVVEEAETGDPLFLKQFGASQLLLAGLSPEALDPGQVVEITRYEGGGYEVELDLQEADDAM